MEGWLKELFSRFEYQESGLRHLELAFAGLMERGLLRENAYVVLEVDTLASTRSNPTTFDPANRFGFPANSLRVLGVGGGTLELSLNGGDWFAVAVGDTVEHFALERIAARATTPAAGTARIWIAAQARRRG